MTASKREREARYNELVPNRENEARIHEELDDYSMDYMSPLDVPHGVKRQGYSYHWATTSVRGENVNEVENLLRKKWQMVPADRSPNHLHNPLGRNPYAEKYISTKDLILMERPTIYSVKENAAFNARCAHKVRSLIGVKDTFGLAPNSFGGYGTNRINSF